MYPLPSILLPSLKPKPKAVALEVLVLLGCGLASLSD
jgi:hypothetical protein